MEMAEMQNATPREAEQWILVPILSPNLQAFTCSSYSIGGLITYSEAIAYSGSLLHRSDSSATSGHSFDFPILPGEGNTPNQSVRLRTMYMEFVNTVKARKGSINIK